MPRWYLKMWPRILLARCRSASIRSSSTKRPELCWILLRQSQGRHRGGGAAPVRPRCMLGVQYDAMLIPKDVAKFFINEMQRREHQKQQYNAS